MRPLRPSDLVEVDWDGFAIRCGASHHSALGHVRFQNWRRNLRFFEAFRCSDGALLKVGQCAIACGQERRFIGGLQLLPDHSHDWKPMLAAVLRALGPGRYRYGSKWDLESPRDQALRELDGVSVQHVEPLIMQAVEFSRWASWDAYFRAVSNNARRNAKRATQSFPDLGLTHEQGLRAVGQVQMLTWLRILMCRRKHLRFNAGREWLRSMLRAILWRRHGMIATVRSRRETLAMVSCIEFGANTYYMEGASRPTNGGAAWHLMLSMLQRAFERHPTGRFVMGVVVEDADLTRSREQCRVSGLPICIVAFNYDVPRGYAVETLQRVAEDRASPRELAAADA